MVSLVCGIAVSFSLTIPPKINLLLPHKMHLSPSSTKYSIFWPFLFSSVFQILKSYMHLSLMICKKRIICFLVLFLCFQVPVFFKDV